jgi:hypothetical protein
MGNVVQFCFAVIVNVSFLEERATATTPECKTRSPGRDPTPVTHSHGYLWVPTCVFLANAEEKVDVRSLAVLHGSEEESTLDVQPYMPTMRVGVISSGIIELPTASGVGDTMGVGVMKKNSSSLDSSTMKRLVATTLGTQMT